AHGVLGARDREHGVGRRFALRPGGEELPLRGDRLLVVAASGIGHADPVLGVRRELARWVGDEEALHRRDGERVVAELELVERRLVGAHLRGRGFRLGRGGGLRGRARRLLARLLELAKARIDVEIEILLAALGGLGLVRERLELAAHARELVVQRLDLRGELQERAAIGGSRKRGVELLQLLGDLALVLGHLLAQDIDAPARLVVAKEALRSRVERERAAGGERKLPQHQYSPLYSMSSRRFFAQHSSLCSAHAGFSSPRLTASICSSRAPSSVSIFFTASERRWPRPTLYSRLPRSSALPWISILALGLSRRNLACASTSGRYSGLTSNLSKSKYTVRFERMLPGSLSAANGEAPGLPGVTGFTGCVGTAWGAPGLVSTGACAAGFCSSVAQDASARLAPPSTQNIARTASPLFNRRPAPTPAGHRPRLSACGGA